MSQCEGSGSDYESGGQEFESLRARQKLQQTHAFDRGMKSGLEWPRFYVRRVSVNRAWEGSGEAWPATRFQAMPSGSGPRENRSIADMGWAGPLPGQAGRSRLQKETPAGARRFHWAVPANRCAERARRRLTRRDFAREGRCAGGSLVPVARVP